jgi:Mu transposase-like protein
VWLFSPHLQPSGGLAKGKVERGGVGYVRQNFWPLRQFTDLSDGNRQVREWLDQVANQPLHRETRQRPCERFGPDCQRPLPALLPDYRDTAEALAHKVLRLQFDGNRYCAPAHLVGQRLTVKADASSVVLYHRNREIFAIPAAGGVVKPLGSSASRKNCSPFGPQLNALRRSGASIPHKGAPSRAPIFQPPLSPRCRRPSMCAPAGRGYSSWDQQFA